MKRTIVVNDRMQKGYVDYRMAPVGRNFAPGFDARLAPKHMLEFGGDTQALRAGRVGCGRRQRQAVLHRAYDSRTI